MTITEFKKIYKEHSPCPEGSQAFEAAATRVEVFRVMTHPSWYDFVMQSIARKWGPTPEDIDYVFYPYINGRHVELHNIDGHPCVVQMWCGKEAPMVVQGDTRLLILCGVVGTVEVEDWDTLKLVVDANSDVLIKAGPNALVYVETYGGKAKGISGNVIVRKKY